MMFMMMTMVEVDDTGGLLLMILMIRVDDFMMILMVLVDDYL